jgi:hypothetical protein
MIKDTVKQFFEKRLKKPFIPLIMPPGLSCNGNVAANDIMEITVPPWATYCSINGTRNFYICLNESWKMAEILGDQAIIPVGFYSIGSRPPKYFYVGGVSSLFISNNSSGSARWFADFW